MAFFNQSTFQPKRQFRFLINFSQIADIDFMCTKAAKPTYNLGDGVSHKVLNHTFKFPGTVTWTDIEVGFIDAIEPNVGSKFYNMLVNAGYVAPERSENLLQGITKASSVGSLGTVKILQLDGGTIATPADPGAAQGAAGPVNIIEEWTLTNAYLKQVSFGNNLAYAEQGIVNIGATIVYDWAQYNGTPQIYAGSAAIT